MKKTLMMIAVAVMGAGAHAAPFLTSLEAAAAQNGVGHWADNSAARAVVNPKIDLPGLMPPATLAKAKTNFVAPMLAAATRAPAASPGKVLDWAPAASPGKIPDGRSFVYALIVFVAWTILLPVTLIHLISNRFSNTWYE